MKIGRVGASRKFKGRKGYIEKFDFVLGQLLSFSVLKKIKEPRVSFHIDKTNNFIFQKIIRF
jgi:hypothetical protein